MLSLTVTPTGRRGLSGTQFPQLPQSTGQAERGVEEPVASSHGGMPVVVIMVAL